VPQDYIIRLLQQLGAVVAMIAGKRARGEFEAAEQELEEQCLRQTGLPMIVVKQSTPEGLLGLLAMGGARQGLRALTLAELLREDGLLSEQRGNPPLAVLSYRQAVALIEHTLPQLGGEDAAFFRERHSELQAKLRDLAGG
jgi:hypothetical protein